ncbi:treacle protein-like [Schistocerca cancellata]|uniref:treacle protein-like n=1 Tax=Schistocerca cancellata TaxID=274614 RepID=UPI002118B0EE|nr:treacle protein-like [Schistocerca cancellata]
MDGAGRDSGGAAPLTHTSTSPPAATRHPGPSTDVTRHDEPTEKAASADDVSTPESRNCDEPEKNPTGRKGGVGGEARDVSLPEVGQPQADVTDGGVSTVPPFGYYLRRKTAFVNVERIKRFLASSLESSEEEGESVGVGASSEQKKGANSDGGAREEVGAAGVSFSGDQQTEAGSQSGLPTQDPTDRNSGTFGENRDLRCDIVTVTESYKNSGSVNGRDSQLIETGTQSEKLVGEPIRVVVTERSFQETSCVEKEASREKVDAIESCNSPKEHQSRIGDSAETTSPVSATAERGEELKSRNSSTASIGSEKEPVFPPAGQEDTPKGGQVQQQQAHRGSTSSPENSPESSTPATGALVSALKNGKKKLVKRVSFADEGSDRKSLVEEFKLREEEPVKQQEKREKPSPPPRTVPAPAPRTEKSTPETATGRPQRLVLQKTEGGVARLVRVTWLDSSSRGEAKKREEEPELQASNPQERSVSQEGRGLSSLEDSRQAGTVDGEVAAKLPTSPARIFVFPDRYASSCPQDPGPSGGIWRQDSTPTSDDVFLSPTEEAAFASSGRPFSSFVSSALTDRPAEPEPVDVLSAGDSVVSISDSSRASDSRESLDTGSASGYPSSSDSAFVDLAPAEDPEDEEEDSEADDQQWQQDSSSGSSEDEFDENSGCPGEPVTQVDPNYRVPAVSGDPEPDGLPEREFWTEASVVEDRSLKQDSVVGSEQRYSPVENGGLTSGDLATGATPLSVKEVLLSGVVKSETGAAASYLTEVEQVGYSGFPLDGKAVDCVSTQEKCITLNYVNLEAEKGREVSVGDQSLGRGKAGLEGHDSSQLPPTPPPSPVEGEEWEGDPPRAGPSRAYPLQEEQRVLDTQCLREASTTGSKGSKEQSAGILPIPEEGGEDGGREKRTVEPDTERDENCAKQRPEEGQLKKQEQSTSSSSPPPDTDPTNAAVSTVLVLTKDEVYPEEGEREEPGIEDRHPQERVQPSGEVTATGDAPTPRRPQQQVEERSAAETSCEEMPGPPEGEAEVPLQRALDHIEQLQQNLSTRLSPGAVQAIRAELKGASAAASPSGPGSTPDNARRREAFFRDGLAGASPAGGSGGAPATWRRSAELSPPRAAHNSPPGGSTAAPPGAGADSWRRSAELPATTVTKRVLWVAETEPAAAETPKPPTAGDGGAADPSSPPKSARVFISLSPRSVEKLVSGQRGPRADTKSVPVTRPQQNGSAATDRAGDTSRPAGGRDRPDGAAGSPAGRRPGPRPAVPAVKPSVTPRKDAVAPGRTAAVSREDPVPQGKASSPAELAAARGGSPVKAPGKAQRPEPGVNLPPTPKTESNTQKPEVPPKSVPQRSSLAEAKQQSPESPPGTADVSASTTVESTGDDTDIPYADSDDEASAGEMSPVYQPSTGNRPAGDADGAAAAAARSVPPSAGRMSWTQQLLEKLSEEEDAKRKRQAEAPRKPPRLVRYPGQREAEEAQRRASAPTSYHPLQTVGATDPVLASAVPGTDAYAELIDRLIEDGSPATRHRPYRQQYGPGGIPLRRQASLEEDSGSTTSSDGAETARLRQKFEEELRTVAAMQQRRQAADPEAGDRGAGAAATPRPPVPVQDTAPLQRAVSPVQRVASPAQSVISPTQRVRSPPPTERSMTAPRGEPERSPTVH